MIWLLKESDNDEIKVSKKGYGQIFEYQYVGNKDGKKGKEIEKFDIDMKGTYESVKYLIDDFYSAYYQHTIDTNRWTFNNAGSYITTTILLNEDKELADSYDFELWEKGKADIYICDIYIPVDNLTEEQAKKDKLKVR